MAQETEANSDSTQAETLEDNNEVETPALSKDEKAFDSFALGAWAFLTDNPRQSLSEDLFVTGVGKCLTPARVQQLNFAQGTDRKLPDSTELRGNIVYYRTSKGLQRLEIKTGSVVKIGKIKQQKGAANIPQFSLIGEKATLKVQFKDSRAVSNNNAFRLMLEHGRLYLRCHYVPSQPTPSQ